MKSKTKPSRSDNRRKKYTSQFKEQAFERAEKEGVSKAAEDLGLQQGLLQMGRLRSSSLTHETWPRESVMRVSWSGGV